ncbi:MAG TPA: nuclease-related domain-containing protein [Woeseiaceae bacterium]|nr:nuclease-related domain-containing protein [Woeseiaceae bacterium]
MTPGVIDEMLKSEYLPWAGAAAVLLLLWGGWRWYARRGTRLDQVLEQIGFDRIRNLVLPNGDDGEILIDQLLLTAQGLLVLEVKNVQGTVFGSDKMQDWTVIAADRRFTFPNPQPGLYDRIAAVRDIVRQVPVAGRILFLDGAAFPKGVPQLVSTLDELAVQFGEHNELSAHVKVEAFLPHWEALKKRALLR